MVMKEEVESAHCTGHIKSLNQKITLCFTEMFTIKLNWKKGSIGVTLNVTSFQKEEEVWINERLHL